MYSRIPMCRVLPRALVCLLTWCVLPAIAAQDPLILPPAPQAAASGYLLIDADSQKVLAENNSQEALPPASLTKIMTSYLAAAELASGRVSMTDEVSISVKAWRTPGSRMFIQEGTTVLFEDLLKGMIIQSGNDASVAIAEHIGGSEDAFADMMNQQAAQLGMRDTQYMNATGLPAEGHHTTAWDLSLLTRDLITRFPEHYAMYAEKSYRYNDIDQPNRNRLLWRDRTVDGVKTGHTKEAGYCLVASAVRNGMRLISVVMGTDGDETRMRESQKLLSYGFRYHETRRMYEPSVSLKNMEVWYGESEQIDIGVLAPVIITIPRGHYEEVEPQLVVPMRVEAPIVKGQKIGELELNLRGDVLHRVDLIALQDVPEGGVFSRLGDFLYLFFAELF
ncbi:MAG: D-alanyl-D-alanine carboxypeptidase family protein [Pseudomonadales bacterium]|nr:D-alanyl-D-alanine carboxypeptidase family protein [Pseudomonadales bacterium]